MFELAGLGPPDLMLVSLIGDRRPQVLMQTPVVERNPEISPDGKWIAYEENSAGSVQVYVRPFPNVNGGRWQVFDHAGADAALGA